jgi:hypothetical protein
MVLVLSSIKSHGGQKQMTNKQINAAIAETCGWKSKEETNGVPWLWQRTKSDYTIESSMEPPDYCNDLNAMHQAEWSLTDDQLWRMARNIERNDEQWYFRATARQRAEAFLRTLGKWEEAE